MSEALNNLKEIHRLVKEALYSKTIENHQLKKELEKKDKIIKELRSDRKKHKKTYKFSSSDDSYSSELD